jgi:hypothetical protein
MAHDPCKLSKISVKRAVSSEGKGCDEFNHPLLGVRDNGIPISSSSKIKCTICKTEIDLTRNKLEPSSVTYGDGVKGVEFKVVQNLNNDYAISSPIPIAVSSVKKRTISYSGTSYTYNSEGMMTRPSFLAPYWKKRR